MSAKRKPTAEAIRAFRRPSAIDDPLLGTNEVAAIFGVHPITIFRWMKDNPNFPKPGRISANRLGWRRSAIEKYIDSCMSSEGAR
ncbi:MAG: AlpA family phage regulatory protein [Xanthobacteraceae bacterium]